jgi:hypothetical protein
MPPSDQRPKITVEDLLRLKRAERPAAEFWANFERELRQKQLTALLEKRPWWQELPQLFARRAYLPIGATAVLAFTLVSVKFYAPTQLTQVEVPLAARSAVAISRPAETPPAPVPALVSSPLVNRSESAVPAPEGRAAVAVVIATPAVSSETAELMPSMVSPPAAKTPSARSIAANLERLEQSEPELINAVLGNRLSAPARVQSAATPADELASVPVGASRRSRILAQYIDRPLSPEPTAPAIVRERLARHLGDPDITDRISRIGLKGDQVSLGLTLRL